MWMLSNSISGSPFRLCLLLVSEHWCPHRYKIMLCPDTGCFKYPSTNWCPSVCFRPLHGTVPKFLNSGVTAWK